MNHTYYVEIEGLKISACHGTLAAERIVPGEFVLDIRLYYDATEAVHSDSINNAINYVTVIDIVKREMKHPSHLLEHVAGRLQATICNTMPQVTHGRIRIAKVHPPVTAQLDSCAFVIEW